MVLFSLMYSHKQNPQCHDMTPGSFLRHRGVKKVCGGTLLYGTKKKKEKKQLPVGKTTPV